MKIRSGFVSNSSSSSFMCDFCGSVESGYASLSDVEMIECRNGHTLCDHHAIDLQKHFQKCDEINEIRKIETEAQGKKYYHYDSDDRSEIPEKHCPLCCLNQLSDHDELNYYRMRFSLSKEDVLEDIVETYQNYVGFLGAVNEHNRRQRR